MRKLQDAGFETWCVGGAVRDALLGIANQDWDIATAAEPTVVRRMFKRVILLGVEFGTVGVMDRQGGVHEVTTFRRDVTNDGRHAVVEFGASFVDDLNRRDFTINAMAFDPIGLKLFDPFDGRADLAARCVRAVGTPLDRFVEDRLRVLRGIRFAARFGFAIERETWEAMVTSGPELGRLSRERVKQELDKTLEQVAAPSVAFAWWQQCGAFQTLIPSLANVSGAVLGAVDLQPRPNSAMKTERRHLRRQLRLATLFSGRSAREVASSLKSLRASNAETAYVAALVERWQKLEAAMTRGIATSEVLSDVQLRRWAADIGRVRVRDFMRLANARWASDRHASDLQTAERNFCPATAHSNAPQLSNVPSAAAVRRVYRRLVTIAWNDAIEIADLAVDGDDLRAAGVPTGPFFGKILAALLTMVVQQPATNSRQVLLERAKQLYDEYATGSANKSGARTGKCPGDSVE